MTDKLPGKFEKLELLTKWVDNLGAEASRMPPVEEPGFLKELLVLDLVPASEEMAEQIGFLGKVTFKRAAYLELPMTEAAMLATAYMSDRVGAVPLYLTVFKHIHAPTVMPGQAPTLWTYAQIKDLFPSPPTSAFIERHWDAQKYKGANLVDLMGPNDFLLTAEEAAELAKAEQV
ncbi:MAG: hypothetical protein ACN6OP_10945 [Pseudomonadales bacterium]